MLSFLVACLSSSVVYNRYTCIEYDASLLKKNDETSYPKCREIGLGYHFETFRKLPIETRISNELNWIKNQLTSSNRSSFFRSVTFMDTYDPTRSLTFPLKRYFTSSVDCICHMKSCVEHVKNHIRSSMQFWTSRYHKKVEFLAYHWGGRGTIPWTHLHSGSWDIRFTDFSNNISKQRIKYLNFSENNPCIDWIPLLYRTDNVTNGYFINFGKYKGVYVNSYVSKEGVAVVMKDFNYSPIRIANYVCKNR